MGNYWTILSNSAPLMVACKFQIFIVNINMHFAKNKEIMAGIGMANILVHCVGGSLITGFITGFTGLASRAYGAQNKQAYKKSFIQGLTNIVILLLVFVLLAFFSFQIVKLTGQSKQIAEYSYKTMISHLPGLCLYYISDFIWGYMSSQKIYRHVLIVQLLGLAIHLLLSNTISKAYGFKGIIISTNISFLVILIITLFAAWKYCPWNLSWQMFKVQKPYEGYFQFTKQCFFIAAPYGLTLFVFQFMTLYLGSFKMNAQTVVNVAVTNFENVTIAPHFGYSTYIYTKIGHFIGQNQIHQIKKIIKQCFIISTITYFLILIISIIFRNQVASYYFTDKSVFKYFYMLLNYLFIRAIFQVFKTNCVYIFRALGMGSQLVKMSLLSYYVIGIMSMIFLCRYVFDQLKILGIWIGYFIGQLFLVAFFIYKYFEIDLDSTVQQLYEQIRVKQIESTNQL